MNAPNYFLRRLADSSNCTYNSAQRRFLHFSQDFSLVPLPASEETIILFATHLAQRIKPQSMNVYLAAVRSLHISHGLSNPLQPGTRLKQTLCGIERKHFSARKQKMPLKLDILSDIQAFIIPTCDDDTVRWAAIIAGHLLMLRAGEFTIVSRDVFDPSIHLSCSDASLHSSLLARSITPSDLQI